MEMDGMEEIIQDFLMDATEMLEDLDQSFVELKGAPQDMDLLNKVYRTIHTIKGSAGFFGFNQVAEISHQYENILNLIRQEKMAPTPELMDGLFKTIDLLKFLILNIKKKDDSHVDTGPVGGDLKKIVESEDAGGGAKNTRGRTDSEEEKRVEEGEIITASTAEQIVKSSETPFQEIASSSGEGRKKRTEPKESGDTNGGERNTSRKETKKGEKKENEVAQSPKLGEILVEGEVITQEEMQDVLAQQKSSLKFGEALLQKNMTQGKGLEQALFKQGEDTKGDVAIRVEASRLESVLNLVGELVLSRNMLIKTTSRLSESYPDDKNVGGLSESISRLDHVATDLQWAVMKARMQPVGSVFNKITKMVRDVSRSLNKDVEVQISGEDTELDISLIEDIGDLLVYIVRNAVDHGIESPEEREIIGKPKKAVLHLSAYHERKNVAIEVADDGQGIDAEIIKAKAIEKGMVSKVDVVKMSDKDILKFIFYPGFSTEKKITDTSVRNVGMDVVKSNVSKLNGTIDIDSVVGKGTKLTIRLPLAISIIQAIMVKVGAEEYAIPLNDVEEIVRLKKEGIKTVNKKEILYQKGLVIPLVRLSELLAVEHSHTDEWLYAIIIGWGEHRIGLLADRLPGEEEIVIKSLGEYLDDADIVKGAALTGDGKVALILDVDKLFMNPSQEKASLFKMSRLPGVEKKMDVSGSF